MPLNSLLRVDVPLRTYTPTLYIMYRTNFTSITVREVYFSVGAITFGPNTQYIAPNTKLFNVRVKRPVQSCSLDTKKIQCSKH